MDHTTAYAPTTVAHPHTTPYNGQSVAALVLGILGLMFGFLYVILPTLAIIFAGVAMSGQKRLGAKTSGMAIAGLVTGIVGAATWGLVFLVAFSA